MHLPFGCFPVWFLICRLHTDTLIPCNHTCSCPEGAAQIVTNRDLLLGRVERGGDCPPREGATYLGFKEVLGTFDALQGNIDLGQLCQGQQPAFLLQFPRGGLVEYEQELWGEVNTAERWTAAPLAPTSVLPAKPIKKRGNVCVCPLIFFPYHTVKNAHMPLFSHGGRGVGALIPGGREYKLYFKFLGGPFGNIYP